MKINPLIHPFTAATQPPNRRVQLKSSCWEVIGYKAPYCDIMLSFSAVVLLIGSTTFAFLLCRLVTAQFHVILARLITATPHSSEAKVGNKSAQTLKTRSQRTTQWKLPTGFNDIFIVAGHVLRFQLLRRW